MQHRRRRRFLAVTFVDPPLPVDDVGDPRGDGERCQVAKQALLTLPLGLVTRGNIQGRGLLLRTSAALSLPRSTTHVAACVLLENAATISF